MKAPEFNNTEEQETEKVLSRMLMSLENTVSGGRWIDRVFRRWLLKHMSWILRPLLNEIMDRQREICDSMRQQSDSLSEVDNNQKIMSTDITALRTTVIEICDSMRQQSDSLSEVDNNQKIMNADITALRATVFDNSERINTFSNRATEAETRLNRYNEDLGAVSRQVMYTKWKLIDHLRPENEHPDDVLTCIICGASHRRGEYQTKEIDCRFHGGHLERYVCPECGAIFGPSKFSSLGQSEIDDDYRVHYLGFSEGNVINKEERAFFMLKPEKDKVYLNYGCGKWSHSLQKLREMGYNVYGYEPYAPELDNPYLITDKNKLKKMRFDGIYSNDVLEHLIDPVHDMKFMGEILLGPNGKMSHCTSCYAYKYAHTRFHTVFFTGRSKEILAERAGLEILEICDDLEENDFYCCVFKPKQYGELMPQMYALGNVDLTDREAKIESGGVLYGPYLDLFEGTYTLEIETDADDMDLSITKEIGKSIIRQERLKKGINQMILKLSSYTTDLEFVITTDQSEGTVNSIRIRSAV